jgi:hypothetical protein
MGNFLCGAKEYDLPWNLSSKKELQKPAHAISATIAGQ